MRRLQIVLREIVGLFLDDAGLALGIIAWLAATALVVRLDVLAPLWRGPFLFAGLAAVLVWSCLRHVGQRGSR